MACDERRVVVTHDKDFGELAFRQQLPAESGSVLLRLSGPSPESDNRRLIDVLKADIAWSGHFIVVTDEPIRVRPLPGETLR